MSPAAPVAPTRPDAVAAARRVVTMLNEVDAGLRPPRVLAPMFAGHLRGVLRRMRPRPRPVAKLHRLAVTSVTGNAQDVVAVCRVGGRYSAIGLRMAWAPRRGWVITDLVRTQMPTERHHRRSSWFRHLSDPPGAPSFCEEARR